MMSWDCPSARATSGTTRGGASMPRLSPVIWSEKSFPIPLVRTAVGVSTVSRGFVPLRALSYERVVTDGGTRSPPGPAIMPQTTVNYPAAAGKPGYQDLTCPAAGAPWGDWRWRYPARYIDFSDQPVNCP